MAADSPGSLSKISLVLVLTLFQAAGHLNGQEPTPPYLGEAAPGRTPIPFAPHVFTRELHSSPVFAPNMTEVFWSEMEGGDIHFMTALDGRWSEPRVAPFSLPYSGEPVFAPDGNTLYFLSPHEFEGSQSRCDENVWVVARDGEGWSDPEPLGPVVNDHPMHWGVSLAGNGNLYFGRTGESGGIFVSEFSDGHYQEPSPLSSSSNVRIEGTTPEVAADEGWLVFARGEGTSSETLDLFVTFRTPDGQWTDPVPMDGANSQEMEISPRISPDGEYLFFLRRVEDELRPFWVSADIIQESR
ncbi:MAG: hypothetical protein PVJ76_18715, partial [Gemmatimonadota bacterium]|jgi:hypothetical protein